MEATKITTLKQKQKELNKNLLEVKREIKSLCTHRDSDGNSTMIFDDFKRNANWSCNVCGYTEWCE